MRPQPNKYTLSTGSHHSAQAAEGDDQGRSPDQWTESSDARPLDYYAGVRYDVVSMIPPGVESILEVGCGAGQTGALLRKRGVRELIGVEINPHLSPFSRPYYSRLIIGDVEQENLWGIRAESLDCLLYPDVLEHLRNPWKVVRQHMRLLRPRGFVVASIPNVRYYKAVRDLVIRGRWDYQDAGILDRGHLRFFTRMSIEDLFLSSGLVILRMETNLRGPHLLRLFNKLVFNRLQAFLVKQYLILGQKSFTGSSTSQIT